MIGGGGYRCGDGGNRSAHWTAILCQMGTLLTLCLHSFFTNVFVDVPVWAQFRNTTWLLVKQSWGVFLSLMPISLISRLLLCSSALPVQVGGFVLLHLNLLRFLFDLDLLRCSPPSLSLLLQLLWSFSTLHGLNEDPSTVGEHPVPAAIAVLTVHHGAQRV